MGQDLKIGDEVEVVGPKSKETDDLSISDLIGEYGIIKEGPQSYCVNTKVWRIQFSDPVKLMWVPVENIISVLSKAIKYPKEAARKLKLKASGLKLTILESKGDQVRFKLENGVESGWILKEELDKISVQL